MHSESMVDSSTATCDWMEGIGLSVLASIVGAASKLAIRKSFLVEETRLRKEPPASATSTPSMHTSNTCHSNKLERSTSTSTSASTWLRLSGMFGMAVLNPLCGVLAMNYASPSLVAPFSGLDLVWVILFSNALVGEDPTFFQVISALQVVFGEALIAIFGDHTNNRNGNHIDNSTSSLSEVSLVLQGMLKSYQDPAFVAYHISFVLWMILLIHWMHQLRSSKLQRFAWGVAGGSVTGLQHFVKDWLTLLKVMMSTNQRVSEHDDLSCINGAWCYPLVALSILAILSMMTAFGGLLLLTACMKRYNATFSSAMFVGSFVFNSSIMSVIHYHTFSHFSSPTSYVLYPMGLFILLAGVFGIFVSSLEPGHDESELESVQQCGAAKIQKGQDSNLPNDNVEICDPVCHSLGLYWLLHKVRGYYSVVSTLSSDEDSLHRDQCDPVNYGACCV